MIVEYIRYRIPADGADFEAAYARAAGPLSRAPQCVEYELTRCSEDPESYVLRIIWTSAEDHIQGFRRSPLFGEFFAEIKPYLAMVEEMRHYERTAVTGPGGAAPAP